MGLWLRLWVQHRDSPFIRLPASSHTRGPRSGKPLAAQGAEGMNSLTALNRKTGRQGSWALVCVCVRACLFQKGHPLSTLEEGSILRTLQPTRRSLPPAQGWGAGRSAGQSWAAGLHLARFGRWPACPPRLPQACQSHSASQSRPGAPSCCSQPGCGGQLWLSLWTLIYCRKKLLARGSP